ncbi:MAG: hypothetical protein JSS44_04160 [Proteobacteria bacterium]|nr:hypothetical protein [Pseudomonadota bacterium]MBS0462140.1 hypothetical protein [Pseudomonadota bacterium]MBS0463982.1 hypothetical protein [Pseudomonadota bacterium]
MATVCFTGMDRAEEARIKALFADANARLGGDWTVVAEAQAKVLVVDMESMYGHMTWLKAHKTKRVIAISSHPDSEAEVTLVRPVTVEALAAALARVAGGHVTDRAAITGSHPALDAPAAPASAPAPPAPAAPAHTPTAAPAPSRPVPPPPAPPTPAQPAAVPTPAPVRQAPASRDPVLWDFLQPGGLHSPSQLDIPGAPALVIDPRSDSYIGGPALKPYIPYCELGTVRADRWKTLSGADVNHHLTGANVMQPLGRLRWLYALIQGQGELAPGYDPEQQFRLTKYPKNEREFPKHLRIATTMMQGPGRPAEIAMKSDTPLADVNDFINASLVSGFAEVVAPPSAPAPAAKSGGLLGRLRGGR